MAQRPIRRSRRRNSLVDVLRRLISTVLALALLLIATAALLIYREVSADLPPIEQIAEYRPPVVTQVFARDGTLIAEFYSEKRYLVPIDQIPEPVQEAFVAAEDDGFYEHGGIEPVSILRAALNNVLVGGRTQGGSTITQQVVKNLILKPERTYERKLKEILLAHRLEQRLSKGQILELYLNHIYLGSGAYGVAAAAREYFGKDLQQITLAEAALLAGLPQAPSRYSPFRNWLEAKGRQRYVLKRMHQAGFITREERDEALRQPLALATRKGNFLAAPYFVEHVRRLLEQRYGRRALYELGLRVFTTVDLKMQSTAEASLRAGLEDLAARHRGYRAAFREMEPAQRDAYLKEQERLVGDVLQPGRTYEAIVTSLRRGGARVQVGSFAGDLVSDRADAVGYAELELNDLVRVRFVDEEEGSYRFAFDASPALEGALVALDPRTGEVRSLVGGYDFDRSQFNRAVQARRQPGSAFKPFIYAAALDRGFTPATVIVDEPIFFHDNGRIWSPRNFEERYHGPTTLRTALTFSRNVVTVRLTDRIGVRYLIKYLARFGLEKRFARNLSIALGSSELTPLELATAYATFGNGGRRIQPRFISKITDGTGNVLEEADPVLADAIPPETAYQVTSMLQDVITRGTGRRADGLGRPTAGKTGTTNEFHDNWFVGYTPQMLAAVWMGFDNKRSLGSKETGGRNAAPVWKAFMEVALNDLPPEDFPIPDGLKCVNVNPRTGRRALPGGPSRLECFRSGREPQLTVEPPPAVQPVADDYSPTGSVRDFLRNDF